MNDSIAIVDSGSGNLRSVERALASVGGKPVVTGDPDAVRRAQRIVVPGQGAFADCMSSMRKSGLAEALIEAVAGGTPYFGICLGLQILFDESDEHGPVPGLGILPGRVIRFSPSELKVPHMGWNNIHGHSDEPMLRGIDESDQVYFIHSYYAVPEEKGDIALTSDYGGEFCAAVRRGNLFACQFHPEKSQAVGLRILQNFVAGDLS